MSLVSLFLTPGKNWITRHLSTAEEKLIDNTFLKYFDEKYTRDDGVNYWVVEKLGKGNFSARRLTWRYALYAETVEGIALAIDDYYTDLLDRQKARENARR